MKLGKLITVLTQQEIIGLIPLLRRLRTNNENDRILIRDTFLECSKNTKNPEGLMMMTKSYERMITLIERRYVKETT